MSTPRIMRIIARMNVGGPALQIAGLTERLPAEGFDHRLFVGDVGPGEEDYLRLRAPHLPVERVPGLGRDPRPHADLQALAELVKAMRRFRPHIVHTHTAKAGVLGRIAARLTRVPHTVHTFHGHLLHGYFSPAVTRLVTGTEAALARSTDRLVAVGERVRDELLDAGVGRPEQYRIVPPGVSLPEPPPRHDARVALGLGPDQPVVAFVARLTRVKRPDRLVEVAARLASSHPDLVFLVVGEGPLLADMRADVRARDLGGSVRFLGWRSDVERVYAASDAVLLCSDNEGTPLSLIEAALCGVPAVTTGVGSVAEVVLHDRTGLVTPPDVDALTLALARLLGDDRLRADLAARARASAERRYGVERLVRDTSDLYRELLAW